ncbi:glycosyltransferase family 4 protein [Patescibacteria group bacterium]|nr:glycosyltransferase family 4 protein [Patescibacteria group bacterium]
MRIAMIGQKGVEVGNRGGGIEVHVVEISKRLVEMGHDVSVYARAQYSPKKPLKYFGVSLIYTPTIYTKRLEAIVHTFLSTMHAVRNQYDVIHYHGVGPSTLSFIPRILAPKVTVINTFHARDQFNRKWGRFARLFLAVGEWTAVRFPHYCIAVSHGIQVYCRDVLNREVVYIPNGANIQVEKKFSELKKLGFKKDDYILTVGRITQAKGLHYLIPAFKQIKTKKQLVIVGAPSFTDEYYEDLRKQAKKDRRVHFVGYQSGDALRQLFAHAHLYVQASEIEGLPLVVLEAMSYGVPPLVSDIPPNLEAIHGAGFTFKTQNTEDLRKQLQDLLDNPKLVKNQSEEAIATIETQFNWDIIADHTEGVYISARH